MVGILQRRPAGKLTKRANCFEISTAMSLAICKGYDLTSLKRDWS